MDLVLIAGLPATGKSRFAAIALFHACCRRESFSDFQRIANLPLIVVRGIFKNVNQLDTKGTTIILIEQNAKLVRKAAGDGGFNVCKPI